MLWWQVWLSIWRENEWQPVSRSILCTAVGFLYDSLLFSDEHSDMRRTEAISRSEDDQCRHPNHWDSWWVERSNIEIGCPSSPAISGSREDTRTWRMDRYEARSSWQILIISHFQIGRDGSRPLYCSFVGARHRLRPHSCISPCINLTERCSQGTAICHYLVDGYVSISHDQCRQQYPDSPFWWRDFDYMSGLLRFTDNHIWLNAI